MFYPGLSHGQLSCYTHNKCRCEDCCAAHARYMRDYWAERRSERSEYRKKKRQENPEQHKNQELRSKYGITLEEHKELFTGYCTACGEPMEYEEVVTDHDHVCLCVRGLIHASCNKAIGFAQDSPKILRALADYLEAHRSQHA